jgi:hypothetical protein
MKKESDFNEFNSWLDKKWKVAPRPHLLVYPEGHRMYDAVKAGELKKGMLRYAYDRKIPV